MPLSSLTAGHSCPLLMDNDPFQLARAGGAFFRRVVEWSSDVVYLLDGQGIIRYVSPAVTEVLEYEPSELIGTDSLEGVHPEDVVPAGAAWQDLLAGNAVAAATVRVRHRTGTWREMEWAATNLLDDPEVRGVVVIARDVTVRRRLERELDRLQQLTSPSVAEQLAHRFHNVLMGIQPMIEVIRLRYAGDEKLMRMTGTIAAALARGKGIIREVQASVRSPSAGASTIGSTTQATSERLRTLLVEDDEAVATGIMSLLEAENIDMRLARSRLDVPPLLESLQPELVNLDLTLP